MKKYSGKMNLKEAIPFANETINRARELRDFRLTFCNAPDSRKKPPLSQCTSWNVPFITVDGNCYPYCSLTEGSRPPHICKFVNCAVFDISNTKVD